MINLLPDDNKKEIRAARMNVVLLRYNIFTAIGAVLLVLIIGGFYFYLMATKASAEQTNQENQAKAADFESTRKAAEDYRTNLKTAKQILNNRVDYTSVVLGITELLPRGVVLDNVKLAASDFGSQTTIAAHAANYDAVTQLKTNFQDSKVFSNVYFQSITNDGSSTDTNYPISVTISVKINKVGQE
jgi:Tfp pilus assembly protein PilN